MGMGIVGMGWVKPCGYGYGLGKDTVGMGLGMGKGNKFWVGLGKKFLPMPDLVP